MPDLLPPPPPQRPLLGGSIDEARELPPFGRGPGSEEEAGMLWERRKLTDGVGAVPIASVRASTCFQIQGGEGKLKM